MKTRTFTHSMLLLTVAVSVGAQSVPTNSEPLPSRPLNLSLRKQVVAPTMPVAPANDKAAGVRHPFMPVEEFVSEAVNSAVHMPYGTGFESRQQGNAVGSGNAASSGAGSGGSGGGGGGSSGGGGRGGSGRGR